MTADATWSTWPTMLFAGVAVPASLLHRLVVAAGKADQEGLSSHQWRTRGLVP
jgi:hypothetical protein